MSWFVIDQYGEREIPIEQLEAMRKSLEPLEDDELSWTAFVQLAVYAPVEHVLDALKGLAASSSLRCVDARCISAPAILVAHLAGWTFIAEPTTELELRFVNADLVDALFEALDADGLFFGYEEDSGTLHLARFLQGQMKLLWYDALEPGPSFALTFHDDGRCTEEDARQFALRELDAPAETQVLDRFAFMKHLLMQANLPLLSPNLHGLPISHQLTLYPAHEAQHP